MLSCIEDNGMWEKIKEGVLLGFSGGADSVFLALALMYLKETRENFPLVLCHVHHGIRGKDADEDMAFSEAFANKYKLEFLASHYDVPSIAKENGLGLEECARNIRYSKFQEIIQSRIDVSYVATAHNATDNLETVIHRLMRGTGSRGACGISPVRDNILRPILYIPKKDITLFLDQNQIPYVTDETNFDTQYTRNFIRNEILPDLARITPEPEVSILRFVQNLREDISCLDGIAESFLESQNLPFVSRDQFLALPHAIKYRVFCGMLKLVSPGFMLQKSNTDELIEQVCAKEKTRISLSAELSFVVEKGTLYFEQKSPSPIIEEYLTLNVPHLSSFFGAWFLLCDEQHYQSSEIVHKNSISVSLSSAIMDGKIYIRTKKPKDSYRVHKMTRKIKTLFSSLHLPSAKTNMIPIICDEKGILFVPPFGAREENRNPSVTPTTNYYIIITYVNGKTVPWLD